MEIPGAPALASFVSPSPSVVSVVSALDADAVADPCACESVLANLAGMLRVGSRVPVAEGRGWLEWEPEADSVTLELCCFSMREDVTESLVAPFWFSWSLSSALELETSLP